MTWMRDNIQQRVTKPLAAALIIFGAFSSSHAGPFVVGGGLGYDYKVLQDDWPSSLKHGMTLSGFGDYRLSRFLEIGFIGKFGLSLGKAPLSQWDDASSKEFTAVAENYGFFPRLLLIAPFKKSEIYAVGAVGLFGWSESRTDGEIVLRHEYKVRSLGFQPGIGYRKVIQNRQLYLETGYSISKPGKIEYTVDGIEGPTSISSGNESLSLSGLSVSIGIAFNINRAKGYR